MYPWVLNSADNAVSTLNAENVSRPVTEGAILWKRYIGLDRPISGDRSKVSACLTAVFWFMEYICNQIAN